MLNFGLNAGKQLFKRVQTGASKQEEHFIVKTLCAIKTTVSWHAEEVGRICRERTGGAGFLTVNAISDAVNASHSGVTAEGDNKVLMQKVVKDILTDHRKKRHDNVKFTKEQVASFQSVQPSDFEKLRDLIFYRETFEIKKIVDVLKHLVFEKEQKFFNVWMSEVNDDIQDLAEAFA